MLDRRRGERREDLEQLLMSPSALFHTGDMMRLRKSSKLGSSKDGRQLEGLVDSQHQ